MDIGCRVARSLLHDPPRQRKEVLRADVRGVLVLRKMGLRTLVGHVVVEIGRGSELPVRCCRARQASHPTAFSVHFGLPSRDIWTRATNTARPYPETFQEAVLFSERPCARVFRRAEIPARI